MKHFHTRRVILLLLGIPVLTFLSGAAFSQPCDQWAGKMVSVQGSVEAHRACKIMPAGGSPCYP